MAISAVDACFKIHNKYQTQLSATASLKDV